MALSVGVLIGICLAIACVPPILCGLGSYIWIQIQKRYTDPYKHKIMALSCAFCVLLVVCCLAALVTGLVVGLT